MSNGYSLFFLSDVARTQKLWYPFSERLEGVMDEIGKTICPDDVMERPGQFSAKFNQEANRPFIEVYGCIPPNGPWEKYRLAMDGIGEAISRYLEDGNSGKFIRRAYALLSLVLNAIQRITVNLDSSMVEADEEADEEFRERRWFAIQRESPMADDWSPDRYARLIYPFVNGLYAQLGSCSADGGMDDVLILAAAEKRVIWTIADMMIAYERLK